MSEVKPDSLSIKTEVEQLKKHPVGIDNPHLLHRGPEPLLRYKSPDGKEYPTAEAALHADKATLRQKSSVLGKEYPATEAGSNAIRRDEAAYWERQNKK